MKTKLLVLLLFIGANVALAQQLSWWPTGGGGGSSGTVTSVSGSAPIVVTNGTTTPAITLGVVPVVDGGTNSSASLANNLVMVSSGGAVIEGTVTKTELLTLHTATDGAVNSTLVKRDGSGDASFKELFFPSVVNNDFFLDINNGGMQIGQYGNSYFNFAAATSTFLQIVNVDNDNAKIIGHSRNLILSPDAPSRGVIARGAGGQVVDILDIQDPNGVNLMSFPSGGGVVFKPFAVGSPPFSCDVAHDGGVYLTQSYLLCVCKNGTGFVLASAGTGACS